jgi:hypothetical protein
VNASAFTDDEISIPTKKPSGPGTISVLGPLGDFVIFAYRDLRENSFIA